MAIVQTGSVLQFPGLGSGNTGTVSSTITVPADAELVVVGWSGFSNTSGFFSSGGMTFTKGGVDTAMNSVAGGDTAGSNWGAGYFYLVLPDTGSNKTLKWDWLGAGVADSANNVCSVTFWKGIDTASPVRGSSAGQSGTTPPYTSGTITAASGDLIIAWVAGFVTAEGTINTWSNLSLLSQITADGPVADGAWATGSPSGNTTVAASTGTNFDDGGIVAVAFKAAAAGGTSSVEGGAKSRTIFFPGRGPTKGLRPTQAFAPTVPPLPDFNIGCKSKIIFTPGRGPRFGLRQTAAFPDAISGTNTNLVPLQGNLVLSPTAESLDLGLKPAQGNLVLSPTAESLGFGLTPAQGNLVLSPTAETVTLSNNINLVVPQGNLVLSEVAPNVSSNLEIQIGFSQGFLFHPGRGPSWDIIKRAAFPADVITANRNIVSPQGNLVLSPTAESLGLGLTPAQGNLVLSPTAESLGFGLKPAQGNLVLSPTAETVVTTANFAFTIPQGNLALSPTAPSIAAQVPQGNLVLSPTAPTIVWTDNHPITVPQGNLALSPTAESLGLGLKPAQGNLALSPTAPTVVWTDNHPITVPQGNVALSSTAPQIGGAMSRLPPQGNVALSPTAPTVVATANWAIIPPQGNVALSPTAPNSVVNFRVTVAQGNIVLSGTPPQTTPGIHPVSGNLILSSTIPRVDIKHTHHWRRVTSLSGSVDTKPNLTGNIDQNKDIGAG